MAPTLATSPAQPNSATTNRKALHFLYRALGIGFPDELYEAAVLANRDLDLCQSEELVGSRRMLVCTYVVNIPEWRKEGPQRILGYQWRQSSHEYRRIVRVRRRQLLAVGTNQVRQNRPSLRMMLPRLLGEAESLRHDLVLNLLRQSSSNGISLRSAGSRCTIGGRVRSWHIG